MILDVEWNQLRAGQWDLGKSQLAQACSTSGSPLRIISELNMEWNQLMVDQWDLGKSQFKQTCSIKSTAQHEEIELLSSFTLGWAQALNVWLLCYYNRRLLP